MQPYVGQIVLYRLRPGQVRAGVSELAAIVTRVHPLAAGEAKPCVDLRVFVPDSLDPLVQPRVMAQSEAVCSHCWRPTDAPAAQAPRAKTRKRGR